MNSVDTYPDSVTLPALESARTPNSLRTVSGVLLILMIGSATGLAFVPWQQSVSGAGRVSALTPVERQQSIDAPVDGRIVQWHVIEGSRVKKNDPIVEIADMDPNLPLRLRTERDAALDRVRAVTERQMQLEERIREMQESLKNEIDAADFRIQQASDRVRGAEQALESAEARELVAKQNRERHQILFPKGLASRRQLELAEAEAETASADLRRARAALDEARNFEKTVQAERARTVNNGAALIRDARASLESAKGEIASAKQALQPIEVRLQRQTTQTVLAPADGTIFRLMRQPGSAVLKAGDEIASFVPETTSPVVEVLVTGNDMPLLQVGRHVRLQFEGWPAVQFVGWPSVAVGTFGGRVLLVDPTDNGQGSFRVLVGPDPNDQPWPSLNYLRQGVRVKAWILLETVPLGFELWRQFNGFPPSVAPPDAPDGGAKKGK